MNESYKKPEIVVFAGPNGSGKSTFTEYLKPNDEWLLEDIVFLTGIESASKRNLN